MGGGARASGSVAGRRHGEQRRKNAAFEAKGVQLMPLERRNVLAKTGSAIGSIEGGVLKVEWTEKESVGVKKGNDVGPSDVVRAVGSDRRINKVAVSIIDGAGGVDSVGVPFGPPARVKVREIAVRGMASKEMNIVASRDSRISTTSVRIVGKGKIDLNQIPTGSEGIGGSVRDEEESIGGLGDGGIERIGVEGRKRGQKRVKIFGRNRCRVG